MTLKAIVAMASNRVIGRGGDLPWRLSEDLKWFKKLTMGSPILMGRKTMDSIGRALPGRRNIVLSRSLSEGDQIKGFDLIRDPNGIDFALKEEDQAWVIGGSEIYRLLIPRCEEIYLSYVFEDYEGDTFLPPFEEDFELAEVLAETAEFELRRYIRKGSR